MQNNYVKFIRIKETKYKAILCKDKIRKIIENRYMLLIVHIKDDWNKWTQGDL